MKKNFAVNTVIVGLFLVACSGWGAFYFKNYQQANIIRGYKLDEIIFTNRQTGFFRNIMDKIQHFYHELNYVIPLLHLNILEEDSYQSGPSFTHGDIYVYHGNMLSIGDTPIYLSGIEIPDDDKMCSCHHKDTPREISCQTEAWHRLEDLVRNGVVCYVAGDSALCYEKGLLKHSSDNSINGKLVGMGYAIPTEKNIFYWEQKFAQGHKLGIWREETEQSENNQNKN